MAASYSVTHKLAGEDVEFKFRKPTAREWMDFEAAQLAFGTASSNGTLNAAISREMLEKSEELCIRIITSHSPEKLQELNEEHLGIFFPIAVLIADVINQIRGGTGKASAPSSTGS